MDLSTITAADFKALFSRDFPYLPEYDPDALYNSGEQVYYTTTRLFYKCMVDGTTGVAPNTDSTKWQKIADDVDNYISDADITKAFAEAKVVFNQALFGDDATIELAYLYLTAHYLCIDIRNAMRGISATGAFPVTGRTVGSVSESYGIPTAYTDNPIFAMYSQTGYGLKYFSFVLPNLVGNIGVVAGWTHP